MKAQHKNVVICHSKIVNVHNLDYGQVFTRKGQDSHVQRGILQYNMQDRQECLVMIISCIHLYTNQSNPACKYKRLA